MKAVNLKADQLTAPLGLENRRPVISWNCSGGIRQSAYEYRIIVNDTERFSSEKIDSDEMSFLCPFGFAEKDRVEICICLFDENGEKGEESSLHFEMGIAFWKARWIDPEPEHGRERQPASVLKKEFRVAGTGRARLYITCHGLYRVFINKQRVGDFVLAPGTDDYRRRLQYQVYDVGDMLREGANLIEVVIGDGWYRGNNGIDGHNHVFGDDLALLCQLEVSGEPVLISDESWFASQDGPIRFTDMEIGEVYDSRREEISTWHEVKPADYGYEQLVCSDEVFIKEHEIFEGRRIAVPDQSIVYDFGQNLAGYTSFVLNAEEGQKITIWHGETLDENGNFTQRNIDPGKRNKNGGIPQKTEYICRQGLNVYQPSFSIFGFRYIRVETDIDLTDAQFRAAAVYSDMEQTAGFRCSNEEVNQLFHNCVWSMKSNFVDIPTDCPHRERSGWTGDAAVFVRTGLLLHDCYTVYRKWLKECVLNQKKNGIITNVAPPISRDGDFYSKFIDGSTGWGDAIVIIPYNMYRFSGDRRILEENYDAMKGWIGYLNGLAKKKKMRNMFRRERYRDYIIETGFHWGEWCQPDVDSTSELKENLKTAPKSATAYYFYSCRLLSEIAEILGRTEDAAEYRSLSGRIREAYIRAFTDDGIVRGDRQCDYLRAIEFDLTDRKEENAALLNEMLVRSGYHLNTGFLSTQYLCPVLCRYGYAETAYRLLLQTENPSWLHQVRKGATTVWENWNGIESGGNASLNHYSYGTIAGWLISGVCGIEYENRNIRIRPCPDRSLEYAQAFYKSPEGMIRSSWRYSGEGIDFEFELPAGAAAEIVLPDRTEHTLTAGVHHLTVKQI